MTSPLPPRLRDTRGLADRARQDRANLKQLGVGFMGGRYSPIRRLGSTAQLGDLEDDELDETITFINTDRVVATGPGNLRFPLSYTPMPNSSLLVFWGGLPQPPTAWILLDNIVTVLDPSGWIRAGHVFTAYYATVDEIEDSGPIDWGSTGPMLTVAEGSTTDYSGTAFDDSSWTETAAPGGHPLGANPAEPSWPDVVYDAGSTDAGVWLRRTITVMESATLSIKIRNDGQWWVYCDGTLVASDGTGTPTLGEKGPYVVPVTAGTHVVAVHVNDDSADPGSDFLYADVNVQVS